MAPRLKLYHGTTWANAKSIKDDGFIESSDGLLGPGVYLAREDKARKFAANVDRHGSRSGGLVTVLAKVRNPKYVKSNDKTWRDQGYDACRADHTSASSNMEWCVASARQCKVVAIERIEVDYNLRAGPELLAEAEEDETFFVTCVLPGGSIPVYERPEFPFGRTVGRNIQINQPRRCRTLGSGDRLFKQVHARGRPKMRFYYLDDDSGWICDYVEDYRGQPILHRHTRKQVVVTMAYRGDTVAGGLRRLPYLGKQYRTGATFHSKDTAIADARYRLQKHPGVPRKVKWYRLVDGSGWLHDFDENDPHNSTLAVEPYDPDCDTAHQAGQRRRADQARRARERRARELALARQRQQDSDSSSDDDSSY